MKISIKLSNYWPILDIQMPVKIDKPGIENRGKEVDSDPITTKKRGRSDIIDQIEGDEDYIFDNRNIDGQMVGVIFLFDHSTVVMGLYRNLT